MKLKKGDKVIVIAGKAKGQTGTISRAMPKESMVLLEGVNLVKRHRRPSMGNRQGQIIDKPMPIHASNVMIVDPKTGKGSRIKISKGKDGARERIAVKSGQSLK